MIQGIRAFIAIELSPDIKAELVRLQAILKKITTCPARWVSPENMHLTLCFLGNLSPVQIDDVQGVMTRIGAYFAPLRMQTLLPGAFPDSAPPQTIWVGLGGETGALFGLRRHLETHLRVVGYRPEGHPFRPHLTLARVHNSAAPAARRELGEALCRLDVTPLPVDVAELNLMRSLLGSMGAAYRCLYRVGLTGAGKTPDA